MRRSAPPQRPAWREPLPAAGDGDLVVAWVCSVFIADKLSVSQPTASEHLEVEQRIADLKRMLEEGW